MRYLNDTLHLQNRQRALKMAMKNRAFNVVVDVGSKYARYGRVDQRMLQTVDLTAIENPPQVNA